MVKILANQAIYIVNKANISLHSKKWRIVLFLPPETILMNNNSVLPMDCTSARVSDQFKNFHRFPEKLISLKMLGSPVSKKQIAL